MAEPMSATATRTNGQGSKATKETGARIALIQAVTKDAADAPHAIAGAIEKMSPISIGTDAAVVEQGAAGEMVHRPLKLVSEMDSFSARVRAA